jgi:signal transduction histidine kinase
MTGVKADQDLLRQALDCLLDNAVKYSWPNTTTRIYGGLTGTNRFHISVVSKGILLRPKEASICTERGWRSDEAASVTGEGTGIGLWIVDHIMRAHCGELGVVPTSEKDMTEFKLIFPGPK